MREAEGEGMTAGAISADAAGPSLDSTGFYWVTSVWSDVQNLEKDRDRERVETEYEG